MADVDFPKEHVDSGDVGLELLGFASGSMDALAFFNLGQVFPSARTGNTALLGVALGQGHVIAASRPFAAFAGFLAGAAAASVDLWLDKLPAPRAVCWLLALEACLHTAFALEWQFIDRPIAGGGLYGLIVVASSGMGIQSVAARLVGRSGITTVVFTSTLTSIVTSVTQAMLWAPHRLPFATKRQIGMFLIYGVGAAIADTPGAAHAVARFGAEAATVVAPGAQERTLAPLPVGALRLPEETVTALRRLGFDRVAQLAQVPRAPLQRRFGRHTLLRLDQAAGRVFEPIRPAMPEEAVARRLAFVEPLLTTEAFVQCIDALLVPVCARLEASGQGARRLDLIFERIDGSVQAVRIGTAAPSRRAGHLGRLLEERLDEVDPGLGVEAMQLRVSLAEPIAHRQGIANLDSAAAPEADIAALVDRIENRLGAGSVWRAVAVESEVPERAVATVAPIVRTRVASWPPGLPRPVRLLDPPQPVEAMALLPDNPPVAFTWRRRRHRVCRADGPERIHGEWWRRSAEEEAVRDYFAVEDEDGTRFWLFRRGDGVDRASGDLRWFLHGLF